MSSAPVLTEPFDCRTGDGVRLRGEIWGSGGHTVVLAHGAGQSRHAWRRTAVALAAAGLRVVAYDARGHGDSDWSTTGDYSRVVAVQDLDAVIAAVTSSVNSPATSSVALPAAERTAEPPVLAGFSMGGDTCLGYGADRPVAGVVLVDVAPAVEPGGVDEVQRFLQRCLDGFADPAEAALAVGEFSGAAVPPPATAIRRHLTERDGRFFFKWDPAVFDLEPDLLARRVELEEAARRVTAPLLLVRGAMSSMLSDSSVRALLAVRPDAGYVNVADAGHSASAGSNDAFADALIRFVRQVTTGDLVGRAR